MFTGFEITPGQTPRERAVGMPEEKNLPVFIKNNPGYANQELRLKEAHDFQPEVFTQGKVFPNIQKERVHNYSVKSELKGVFIFTVFGFIFFAGLTF